MGVEVGDVDSNSQGLADLSPGLEVGLLRRALGIDLLHGLPQVAVGVDEARNLRARGDRTPAIESPFRGLGQVQTEVFFRVCFGVTHHLGEPRAGDHQRGAGHQAFFEALDGGQVGRMAHSAVVAVNNEELGVGRVAQADIQWGLGPGQPAGQAEHRGK